MKPGPDDHYYKDWAEDYNDMKTHQYGDGPVDTEYMEKMRRIMQFLDEFVNGKKTPDRKKEIAVVVMMFPFGDKPDGRVNYMSNGVDRRDMVVLMKEQIARFEGMPTNETNTRN